ncbi:receptor activity-modifying protein 1 isoform X3 [Alligator sinensis]|uniref:Receptor activity-modifying protein 1 n=1 Tax=Alligator sinensis TaxID=38654 RepID=A0A3Q0HCD2_ALLSI|nr:receptor activity-modifying protein 1 isoform X3 [Alligator sinensis]
MALLPRRFLCFLLAHHFIVVTACHEASYSQLIQQYCLGQFKLDMEAIGQKLWCDWDETVEMAVLHMLRQRTEHLQASFTTKGTLAINLTAVGYKYNSSEGPQDLKHLR